MVVSIDYRLAPETKLAAIPDDVKDAFAWVRSEGPEHFDTRTALSCIRTYNRIIRLGLAEIVPIKGLDVTKLRRGLD